MAAERVAVIAAGFVEVESGSNNDRLQMAAAKAKGVRLCGYRQGAAEGLLSEQKTIVKVGAGD